MLTVCAFQMVMSVWNIVLSYYRILAMGGKEPDDICDIELGEEIALSTETYLTQSSKAEVVAKQGDSNSSQSKTSMQRRRNTEPCLPHTYSSDSLHQSTMASNISQHSSKSNNSKLKNVHYLTNNN